jgi:hypothetical protein
MKDRAVNVQPERAEVVVIGAGLAGLSAAATLHQAGRDVIIVEASDDIGGRVRTDLVDGFVLDRGFQILLTAYPELSRQLDVAALDLKAFDPGAIVMFNGTAHRIVDPLRQPRHAIDTVRAPIGSPIDKARIARLRRSRSRTPVPELLRGRDMSTREALRADGFSPTIIERFFRPLFGGIQLDPSLATSRRMFDAIFSTLARGDSAVPSAGMHAIPRQLSTRIAPERILLDTPVTRLDGTVVYTNRGTIAAGAVIVATEGPVAVALLGLPPVGSNPVSCAWFAADRPPFTDKLIALDGSGSGPALNVAVLSNVAPTYAPPGQALIAAACPGVADPDIEQAVRAQLRGWWGPGVDQWRHLRTDAIAHGQPTQRVPFAPKQRIALGSGLFVCGDHRDTASIQGALFSGRRCAEAVLSAVSFSG